MRFLLSALLAIVFTMRSAADSVDDYVQAQMRAHPIPGLALIVLTNGQAAKTAAYGLANLEWQQKVTPETVFEIGSVSKQFAATAILLLEQEGKLSLDDKISRYLVDTPASWSNITIRHLLTHTSGLKTYTGMTGFELTHHLSQQQFIAQIAHEPLQSPPGEKWEYCNTGFNLIGFIVQNVSGQSYWDFLESKIFKPLDMKATRSRDPRAIIPHRASGYETNRDRYLNRDYDLTDVFSAGALVSTVEDLAKWNNGLDSDRLLLAASKEKMWQPCRLNNGQTLHYGLGWYLDSLEGHKEIWHSGSTDGFSASLQRFPDDHLVVIVLCNSNEEGIATVLAKHVALLYLH